MPNAALAASVNAAVSFAPAGSTARVTLELGALARLVMSASRVAKALAAPDSSKDSKAALLNDLTRGAFNSASIDLVVSVIDQQRLSGSKLGAVLLDVLAEYAFAAGERDGNVETIEKQLYEFADLVGGNGELWDALTNPGRTDASKDTLVRELLGKADPVVIELVRAVVALDHGRDVDEETRTLSYRAAARRDFVVAEVQTAIELGDEHRRRLTSALSESVGKKVEPRFSVDPEILGSVIVRIGDDVLDGSVRHRLNQARQALLGA